MELGPAAQECRRASRPVPGSGPAPTAHRARLAGHRGPDRWHRAHGSASGRPAHGAALAVRAAHRIDHIHIEDRSADRAASEGSRRVAQPDREGQAAERLAVLAGKREAVGHSDWHELVREAAKGAGLPEGVCLYTLRHSFITQALMDGMATLDVARITGTSIPMITKHYRTLL